MVRRLAYFLLFLTILSVLAEISGMLLPAISWPFTAARDVPFLNWDSGQTTSDSVFLPDGKFLWFAWGTACLTTAVSLWILILPKSRFHFTPMTARRIARFKSIKRGYFSLWILVLLGLLCSLDQCLVGKRALMVVYNDHVYFPAFTRANYPGNTFGVSGNGALAETDYRELKKQTGIKPGLSKVLMPPIPYDPTGDTSPPGIERLEVRDNGLIYRKGSKKPYSGQAYRLYNESGQNWHIRYKVRNGAFNGRATGMAQDRTQVYSAQYNNNSVISDEYSGDSSKEQFLLSTSRDELFIVYFQSSPPLTGDHLLGTNTQGSDILAYLFGGLQVNIKAAVFYLPFVYFIGISIGMLMGYFGGAFDLTVQRIIEIFSQIPFLFVIMIISDMVPLQMKGMFLILILLIMFGWMSMTYQLRTSTMKEKSRDYVSAARIMGASTPRILFVHILPNLIAILITLIPFSVSALILSLASLDYLGFGLPDSYASWGRLLNDGLANLSSPWVVTSAFFALITTLLLVTFIGEAVREAFDPRKFTVYK